jgi:hypothetical protein
MSTPTLTPEAFRAFVLAQCSAKTANSCSQIYLAAGEFFGIDPAALHAAGYSKSSVSTTCNRAGFDMGKDAQARLDARVKQGRAKSSWIEEAAALTGLSPKSLMALRIKEIRVLIDAAKAASVKKTTKKGAK